MCVLINYLAMPEVGYEGFAICLLVWTNAEMYAITPYMGTNMGTYELLNILTYD